MPSYDMLLNSLPPPTLILSKKHVYLKLCQNNVAITLMVAIYS